MQINRSIACTRYKLDNETTEQDVLSAAEGILRQKLKRQGRIANPADANDFLRVRLGNLNRPGI